MSYHLQVRSQGQNLHHHVSIIQLLLAAPLPAIATGTLVATSNVKYDQREKKEEGKRQLLVLLLCLNLCASEQASDGVEKGTHLAESWSSTISCNFSCCDATSEGEEGEGEERFASVVASRDC